MRDYFQRQRCHEGFGRWSVSNRTARSRAKREVRRQIRRGE